MRFKNLSFFFGFKILLLFGFFLTFSFCRFSCNFFYSFCSVLFRFDSVSTWMWFLFLSHASTIFFSLYKLIEHYITHLSHWINPISFVCLKVFKKSSFHTRKLKGKKKKSGNQKTKKKSREKKLYFLRIILWFTSIWSP